MTNLEHIKIVGSLEEIIGKKLPKERIIQLIEQTNLLTIFILLSQLSTGNFDKKKLKRTFQEHLFNLFDLTKKDELYNIKKKLLNKLDLVIQNHMIFPPQTILNMWKWVLSYGNQVKGPSLENINLKISQLFYISLATNDYLYQKPSNSEELNAYLFCNEVFNNEESALNSLVRTFVIYTNIAENRSLYRENEFLDISYDFVDTYGYTIKEHIAIIFGLISSFINPTKLGSKWLQRNDELFENTKLKNKAEEIINSLTIDFTSISEWSKQNIESPWNFLEFYTKPLLRIYKSWFLPFSLKLLYEQLFTGLFHKVRSIYPENNRQFMIFYGRPFEKYAQRLAENSVNVTKLPYKFFSEFSYKYKKNNVYSPDIMVRLGGKLLGIEIKSYRLRIQSIIKPDVDSINDDLTKLIISPLKQLNKRIEELKVIGHDSVVGVWLLPKDTCLHFHTMRTR
jgi:hypothetical protein